MIAEVICFRPAIVSCSSVVIITVRTRVGDVRVYVCEAARVSYGELALAGCASRCISVSDCERECLEGSFEFCARIGEDEVLGVDLVFPDWSVDVFSCEYDAAPIRGDAFEFGVDQVVVCSACLRKDSLDTKEVFFEVEGIVVGGLDLEGISSAAGIVAQIDWFDLARTNVCEALVLMASAREVLRARNVARALTAILWCAAFGLARITEAVAGDIGYWLIDAFTFDALWCECLWVSCSAIRRSAAAFNSISSTGC